MEVTVGAFMFMVLLVLAVFTIVLSTQNIFKEYYEFEVIFQEVMGIRPGDNVLVRGVEVGKVKGLHLEEDGVHVITSLESNIRLRKDYKIEILPSSVLGGKILVVYEGEDAEYLPENKPVYGAKPVDLIDEASHVIAEIRTALDEGGILENLEVTMKQFKEVTGNLSQGKGTLGKLLTDDAVYNDIKGISKNLKTVSQKLVGGEGTLAKLLNDGEVYDDLKNVMDNLSTVSQRVADGKGTLARLLAEDDTLYINLVDASEAIKDITTTINKGEGTLGKLAKDDELYVEVTKLLSEVRATVDDFRETAPITTFTSIFFGAF